MTVGREVAGVFTRNVVTLVLSFGNSILLTRTLGVEGKGEFALFSASVGLLSLLLGLGLDNALRYFVAREEVDRDRILGFYLLVVVGVGLTVFGVARVNHLAFANELLLPASRQRPLFEAVLAGTVAANLFFAALSAVFSGTRAFAPLNRAMVGFSALSLVVYGVLFALEVQGRVSVGAGEIFLVYLGLQTVNALALLVLGMRFLGLRLTPRLPGRALLTRMIRYAGQTFGANLAQFLNYRVDIWIVQAVVGTAPLGLYSLAANLATMLWVLPRSTSQVLMPSMAAGDEGTSLPEAARLARLVFTAMVLLALPLALGARWWIDWLYGGEFQPASAPFVLLLVGCVPFSLCVIQAAALAALDRQRINLTASVVGLVATVALDLLLIPRYGIAGAALASSISYLLTTAVVLVAFARVGGLSPAACVLPQPGDLRYVLDGVQSVLR